MGEAALEQHTVLSQLSVSRRGWEGGREGGEGMRGEGREDEGRGQEGTNQITVLSDVSVHTCT